MSGKTFLLLLLFCLVASILPVQAMELDLTQEESEWLQAHPVIRIAPDPSSAPIEWFGDDGSYLGVAADYVRKIEEQLGIRFEIVHADSWQTIISLVKEGGVDVLPAAMRSPEREEFLAFTEPHIIVSGVVITSMEYDNLEQLKGEKVAVVADYVWDDMLSHHQVDVRMVRVEDIRTGIELTAMGAVDAMVGDIATSTHVIQNEGITNLRMVSSLDHNLELSLAVRRDWAEFATILDKALASISPEEHQAILDRWVNLTLPPWWQDRKLQIVVLGGFGGAFILIGVFVAWNRILRHQVRVRTKELEEAQNGLIRAARLESVGQLAAGVAHEVKNPLGIIQMGVDYLRGDPGPKDEITEELLGDMAEAVKRADNVIRGLLDFSHDSKVRMEHTDLNRLIEKSIHLVEHELRKKKIEFKATLAPSLPDVNIDGSRLQQVFVNTFMNSLHAMESGGCLGVQTREVRVSGSDLKCGTRSTLRRGERAVMVEITDTGHGIDHQDLDKVTDPFFTTKPVGEGTGLGLSICRNIIEMHNGIFTLDNLPEKGVVVRIILPL